MKKRVFKAAATIALSAFVLLSVSGCSMLMGGNTYTGALSTYDFSQMDLVQLDEPYDGQPVAVIETDMGTMTAVLYPEYAPNTVANFIARAEDGYYNNTNIFASITSFCFIAGSSDPEGKTGVTSDGQPIANECDVDLYPFKGALLGYREEMGYSDSRFIACGTVGDIPDEDFDELRAKVDDQGNRVIPEEFIDAWKQLGGLPGLSGMYTVFGQMISGMDVLDKILAVEVVDEESYMPVNEIKIISVTIDEYSAEKYIQ